MKRRSLFVGAIAAGAAMHLNASSAAEQRRTSSISRTFVLVHGAWHGGWCWQRVAERLRAEGHIVFTPTLTGLGERRHLISAQINLDTHIADIINLMNAEELRNVVLVGHSYAGIVISGVADRAPSRIRHLVYLDSLLLESGKSIFSDFPPDVVAERLKTIRETGGGVGAAPPMSPADLFGVTEPADVAWVLRQLTPQPVGTYLQPLSLQAPLGNGLPRTYIDCTVAPLATVESSKARARAEPGWTMLRLAAGHDAMVAAPGPLAEMLVNIG